jgi:hypothetical protein
MLIVSALLAALTVAPALAAMPGPPKPGTPIYTNPHIPPKTFVKQSAAWLYQKNHFQVRRVSGQVVAPSLAISNSAPPTAYTLSTNFVDTTLEPSANLLNSEPYDGSLDDAHNGYTNQNMVNLCAPGALTNTLSFWNTPAASYGTHLFTDLSVQNNHPSGVTEKTTWSDISYNDIYDYGNEDINSNAHRSYMMYLAWLSNPNGEWGVGVSTGVMDSNNYPSHGAYLQWMQDVVNWEAAGHNTSDWSNFFYTTEWHYDSKNNTSGGNQATLLADVESDVGVSHVPVLVEVDANKLPNWPGGSLVKHAIAIIGYDNTSATYTYVDSCGSGTGRGTGCGALYQQKHYTIDQYSMWAAIDAVPYDPSTGDGGWIW